MSGDEDRYRDWDAAYVLGSLDPADRRDFEEHLRDCDACRAAVTELAGLPGLLRLVPAQEAEQLGSAPDGEVVALAALARAADRTRRRRSLRLAAVAAALVLLGGVAGVLLRWPSAPAGGTAAAGQVTALHLEPVGAIDVSADLTLQEKGWGTRIDWECRYPGASWPDGTGPTYELVLVDGDGARTVVATWRARSVGARGLGASSSIATDDITSVEIRLEGAEAPLAASST